MNLLNYSFGWSDVFLGFTGEQSVDRQTLLKVILVAIGASEESAKKAASLIIDGTSLERSLRKAGLNSSVFRDSEYREPLENLISEVLECSHDFAEFSIEKSNGKMHDFVKLFHEIQNDKKTLSDADLEELLGCSIKYKLKYINKCIQTMFIKSKQTPKDFVLEDDKQQKFDCKTKKGNQQYKIYYGGHKGNWLTH